MHQFVDAIAECVSEKIVEGGEGSLVDGVER